MSMFCFSFAEMNRQSSFIFAIHVFCSSSSVTFSFVGGVRSSGSFSTHRYASILLKTIIWGLSAAPRSFRVLFTTSICSSKSGCDMSTTCTSRSASRTSSSVDLNESTRSVGSLRIKPTVSASRNGRFSTTTLRTVVSRVANSLFSANTSLFASRFIIVDFPTLVYPTRATRMSRPRFFRCVVFCLSISTSRCFSRVMRCRIIRRSISN